MASAAIVQAKLRTERYIIVADYFQRWSHACCHTVCLQTFSRSGHSTTERRKRRSHEDGTASRKKHWDHVETSQRSPARSSFKFRSCVLSVSARIISNCWSFSGWGVGFHGDVSIWGGIRYSSSFLYLSNEDFAYSLQLLYYSTDFRSNTSDPLNLFEKNIFSRLQLNFTTRKLFAERKK